MTSIRVLVVEDSPTQAEQVRAILETESIEVDVARQAEEALRLVEANEYALVISDIVMPGMSGYELCRRVKGRRETPIILLTALADPMDIIRGLQSGADNFITKPCEPEYLIERVRSVLGNRRLRADGKLKVGVEIFFLGQRFAITSDKEQILDLLISTFEDVVRTNRELRSSQEALAEAKRQLETYARRLEDKARVSEEKLRLLTARAADAIVVADGEGTVLEANAAALELFGRTDVVGRGLGEILGQPAGEADDLGRRLASEGVRATRPDGRRLDLEGSISWVDLGGAPLCLAILRDVTARRRAESRLLLQHTVSRLLAEARELDATADGVLEALGEALGSPIAAIWRVERESRSIRLFAARGLSDPSCLARCPCPDLVQRLSRGGEPFWLDGPSRAGECAGFEPAQRTDVQGALVIPILLEGEVLGAIEVFLAAPPAEAELLHTLSSIGNQLAQFIERRRAEASLRESEERLRLILDSTAEAIYGLDLEGRCTFCNASTVQMLGYASPGDLLGRRMHDLIHSRRADGTACPEPECRIYSSFRTGEKVHVDGEVFWRSDGTAFPVEYWSYPIRRDGRTLGAVVAFLDVTERRRTEDALRRSEEQLHQAQKMEALGQLAGGIAHDFNNLLTVINGCSDLLLAGPAPDLDPQRELLEIRRAGDQAAALTRQLLSFGRKQALSPRPLDLNAIVREVEQMLRRVIGEDVAISSSLSPGLGRVLADPGRIEQVLINLTVNARDAMPQGGRIAIDTADLVLAEGSADRPASLAPGRYVAVSVSDSGCGMDEATRSRIFEPFFTTKAPGKGTGLGLATVYGIVQQSGGAIRVESEPGRGSRFTVYLPRVDAPVPDESRLPACPPRRGTETVLLVEDQDSVRRLARRILERSGYRVFEAADGEAALAFASSHEGPLDILVTDVVMPEMSGCELARRLAETRGDLKILYLSGYASDSLFPADLPGRRAFLEKPFPPSALAAKVREVLDEGREPFS